MSYSDFTRLGVVALITLTIMFCSDTPGYMSEDTPEVDSFAMGEIIATYKVTSMALVTRDDERSGLTLVIGALYNHVSLSYVIYT